MKKFISAIFFVIAFVGCNVEPTSIVCGREWNPSLEVVADTTSEFELKDNMIVQFRYGKNFDFNKLKVSFFDGTLAYKGALIWEHEAPVNEKMGVYTLQGKSKRGGLMSARELCKQKYPSNVVIEFSANGQVLAAKQVTLTKNR